MHCRYAVRDFEFGTWAERTKIRHLKTIAGALAVVATSWCFNNSTLDVNKVQILLNNYGLVLKIEEFKEYIKYALLYYTTTRYLNNENYKELLKRLENL